MKQKMGYVQHPRQLTELKGDASGDMTSRDRSKWIAKFHKLFIMSGVTQLIFFYKKKNNLLPEYLQLYLKPTIQNDYPLMFESNNKIKPIYARL